MFRFGVRLEYKFMLSFKYMIKAIKLFEYRFKNTLRTNDVMCDLIGCSELGCHDSCARNLAVVQICDQLFAASLSDS